MKTNTNYLTLKTPKRHPRFFFYAAMQPHQPPTHHLYLSIHPSIPPHFQIFTYTYISSEQRSLLQPHLVPLDDDNRARGVRSDLRNNKRIRQRGVSTADFNSLYTCDRKIRFGFSHPPKKNPPARGNRDGKLGLTTLVTCSVSVPTPASWIRYGSLSSSSVVVVVPYNMIAGTSTVLFLYVAGYARPALMVALRAPVMRPPVMGTTMKKIHMRISQC